MRVAAIVTNSILLILNSYFYFVQNISTAEWILGIDNNYKFINLSIKIAERQRETVTRISKNNSIDLEFWTIIKYS